MSATGEAGERIARAFHETYERLAPDHGYETREASAVPWEEVPEQNRRLMIAVADELLARTVIDQGVALADPGLGHEQVVLSLAGATPGEQRVAQRFFDEGMVWLANRVLHPFGWAIGVAAEAEVSRSSIVTNRIVGLLVRRTTDPEGIAIPLADELAARGRFFRALQRRMLLRPPGEPPEEAADVEDGLCPSCGNQQWEVREGDRVERGCGVPRCPLYLPFPRPAKG